jgi:hypothetical protein
MTHVALVPAFQFGHPYTLVILMESDDFTFNVRRHS